MQKIDPKKGNITFVRFVKDQTDNEVFRIQILLDESNNSIDLPFCVYELVVIGGEYDGVILVSNLFSDAAKVLLLFIADNVNSEADLRKVIIHCVTHHLDAEFNLKLQLSKNYMCGELSEPFSH